MRIEDLELVRKRNSNDISILKLAITNWKCILLRIYWRKKQIERKIWNLFLKQEQR